MDAYEQAMYSMAPSYEPSEEEKKRLRMQQLIATGAALMAGRGNFVNNLGQAMLVGQNQGSEGMQDLRRNKLADSQIQMQQMQMQERQMTARAAAEKAAAQQQAAQQYAARMGGALNPPNPSSNWDDRSPTVGNAAKMETVNPLDSKLANMEAAWKVAIESGDEKTAAQILAQMQFIRPKYNPTLTKSIGPDGKTVWIQSSDQGLTNAVGNYRPPRETQLIDLKDRFLAVDKDEALPGQSYAVGMTPSERQNIGLRGGELGLARQRLALENPQMTGGVLPQKTLEFKFGKAPAEKMWTQDGKLVDMPGSNAEKETASRQVSAGNIASKLDNVIATAEKAVGQANGLAGGWMSAGTPGYYVGMIPGTPGANLQGSIDTIKANIGWRELQEMRDASKTGGALGQVAIQELNMLQATLGSLNREQSPPQLRENLGKVIKHYKNAREAMQKAGIIVGGNPVQTNDSGAVNNDPLGLRR